MAVNGKSRQDWMDKCAYSNTDSVVQGTDMQLHLEQANG
ncbi:hypothetical protein FOIG_09419 [Fusarium odoratissimum NRRL 54006]|uniref:Uncharacterized protein n=1 Tax=Fusarium odoratissimum (strain NRRL 54006) TaxID=1089451 RepID=X0JQS7_FUSO5|nr:uncharacterized protein FOIG_09419 [Fusarium odoratissimum NRRL 54006]EXL98685.1 hypothetical protein FOIG_09419 [Fusarium odoratissimum NRRL 54006]